MLRSLLQVVFCMLATLTGMSTAGNSQPKAPRAQWHNEIDNLYPTGSGGNRHGHDWCFGILTTTKKTHVACGFSWDISNPNSTYYPAIMMLDNFGHTLWVKYITQVNDGTGNTPNTSIPKGALWQVIETSPGNYAAVGYGGGTIIIEFDDDGNINSTIRQLWSDPSPTTGTYGNVYWNYSIAMDPTPAHSAYYICGFSQSLAPGGVSNGIVTKIDLPSRNISSYQLYKGISATSATGVGSAATKVLTKTNTSGGYEVYVCGFVSDSTLGSSTVDEATATGTNADGHSATIRMYDKDIFLAKLPDDLSSNTFYRTYNKNDLPAIYYTETGPASARYTSANPNNRINSSAGLTYTYLREAVNVDERASDMMVGADGEIELVAMTNFVALSADPPFRSSSNVSNALQDPVAYGMNRGIVYDNVRNIAYGEYYDADGYAIKLDHDNGDVLTGTMNVGHFSGEDFRPSITQNKYGEYFIVSSTADYYSSTATFTDDIRTPDLTDAMIIGVKNGVSHDLWRRVYRGAEEDAICGFGIDKTADGGFVIAGNNCLEDNNDDYTFSKFAPWCANTVTNYAEDGQSVLLVNTNETWSGNTIRGNYYGSGGANIISDIQVAPNRTLTIQSSTLNFASPDWKG